MKCRDRILSGVIVLSLAGCEQETEPVNAHEVALREQRV